MDERRKKPGGVFWMIALLIGLAIGYPLSCPWTLVFYMKHPTPELLDAVRAYHAPLARLVNRSPDWAQDVWIAYRDWSVRITGL